MSIASEITRLQNIKTAIRTALVNKGITAASTHDMADFADDIDSIQTGGVYPVRIEVATPPTKTSYSPGDALDLTGIVVRAVMSDGSTNIITNDCTFSPTDGTTLTLSMNKVTISWNWASSSAIYNVVQTISVLPSIVSFASGTDAQIADMLTAYYYDQLSWQDMGWAVGDTRLFHFDSMQAPSPNSSSTWYAQDITIMIVAHDHTDLATPINGHTKACITVQTREIMSSNSGGSSPARIYVNGDSSYDTTFTKWSNLYMRTYLNNTVLGAIPSGDFKSAIKTSKHYRHTTYNGTSSEQVIDTLFLPSYPEIFGTNYSSYYTATSPTEGTRINGITKKKYCNDNGSAGLNSYNWWTGSASSFFVDIETGYSWGCVSGTDYGPNGGTSNLTLAPAWAM